MVPCPGAPDVDLVLCVLDGGDDDLGNAPCGDRPSAYTGDLSTMSF